MVICLKRGADLHMAQLMPLSLTVSCFSKIQIGFTFLVPAHLQTREKTPAPHHSVFSGQMPFLPPSQQRQSTEVYYRYTGRGLYTADRVAWNGVQRKERAQDGTGEAVDGLGESRQLR